MTDETNTNVEESPWGALVMGAVMVSSAAFIFVRPDTLNGEKWWLPWVMGLVALIGVCMMIGNAASLYGRYVRKLDPKAASAFAGGVIGGGIGGLLSLGSIAACLFLGYNYLTGPFGRLDHGTKLLASLLALAVILLFYIALELERIRKKP